jgi:hypothetical protein
VEARHPLRGAGVYGLLVGAHVVPVKASQGGEVADVLPRLGGGELRAPAGGGAPHADGPEAGGHP